MGSKGPRCQSQKGVGGYKKEPARRRPAKKGRLVEFGDHNSSFNSSSSSSSSNVTMREESFESGWK